MRRPLLVPAVLALLCPGGAADAAGTWVQTYPGHGPIASPYASLFADGTAFVSRSGPLGSGTHLLRSKDFGLTWTALPSPFPTDPGGKMVMGTPGAGLALSSPHHELVMATRDGGQTWLPVAVATGVERFRPSNAGFAPGGRTVVLAGTFAAPNEGCNFARKPVHVLVSQDSGSTWRGVRLPTSGGVARVAVADARVAAVVVAPDTTSCNSASSGSTSSVWVTEDGGQRWRRSRECVNVCRAVAWASPSRLVVGEWLHGALHVSTDRGRTFRRAGVLRTRPQGSGEVCVCLSAVAFAPNGEGWAVADGDGIWHAPGPDGPWTLEPSPLAPGYGTGDVAVTAGGRAVVVGTTGVLTRVPVS